MKKYSWLSSLFLLILSGIAISVRIYYINNLMSEISINEEIYFAAKVNVGNTSFSTIFSDGFQIKSLYISNLYLMFLIFGNFTVAGVYLNILYQVATVILVYSMVKIVTNKYISFAIGLIAAVLPGYIHHLSKVNSVDMEIFLFALILNFIVFLIHFIYRKFHTIELNPVMIEGDKIDDKQASIIETEKSTGVLMDRSMREIHYDDLEDKKVQYIENPLPVPKRREHKKMDFAFEPTDSNDDYDLKDMTNKDFYDIE
ncbi:MAG: hypothetical protein OSJ73_17365 [Lachnospiraceae bacterium]|nr:hypothetical protein [Lachnospiraceae bacterium]